MPYNELRGGVIFIDAKPGIPRSIAGKIQRKDLKVMAQKALNLETTFTPPVVHKVASTTVSGAPLTDERRKEVNA